MIESPQNLNISETLSEAKTTKEGLNNSEVQRRLLENGKNVLEGTKKMSPVVRFLLQFKDPMIYILIGAAIISIVLNEITDSIIILCVILLNGIVGYIQEAKAEKAIDALKEMSSPKALVKREGVVKEIDASDIVVGDIVVLEAGRVIPADLRLISSQTLKIEESALTGESVPSEKDAEFLGSGNTLLGDRVNMAFSSTPVTYGRGEGVVVATGMQTEIGKIAKSLDTSKTEKTPLQIRMADLSKLLGILTIVLCVALFLVALFQKRDIFETLLTAISLAVAAIPEGLPAVVTIVLAMGVQRMVKHNTIVRRLPSVETLGSVNVVCSDKTGTLTQNKMTTVKSYFNKELTEPKNLDKEKSKLYLDGFVLCNDASIEKDNRVGDPTEIALLDMGEIFNLSRQGLEEIHPRISEIPFDSDRKMMTTVHDYGDKKLSFTKGGLDLILAHTTKIFENGEEREITHNDKEEIFEASRKMANEALRVLALSYRFTDGAPIEDDLCFIGLVGMIDPPRKEAKEAVEAFKKAGVTTVMITGDHKDTALAVAKEIGIAEKSSQCISGEEINELTDEELSDKVSHLRVFSRVSPENKVSIVKAFKADGNIVSMTGDGVNDAPSLRSADIGLAMGITGTDVAKGAADMILTDDNFATIKRAIQEGRNIYNNIKKSTIYLLSSNIGEIVTMFIGILVGWPTPLSAVNILWVNLVTDSLPALALGADPGTPDVMKDKPRPQNENLFAHGGVALLIIYGILIGLTTLFGFILGCFEATHGSVMFSFSGLTHIDFSAPNVIAEGRTFAFTVLAVSEIFHAIGMRNTKKSIFAFNHLNNKLMLIAGALGLVLQFVVVGTPVGRIFGSTPLSAMQWLIVLLLSLAPLVMHEIIVLIQFIYGKIKVNK